MAIGDVTQVTIRGSTQDNPWASVFYYETLTSFGPKSSELWGLVDAVEEFFFYGQTRNDMLDFMHPSVSVHSLGLRDVHNPEVGLDNIMSPILYGGASGEALPPQTAFLIKKATGEMGRSKQGRNYLPLGTETLQNGGEWGTSWLNDVVGWFPYIQTIVNSTIQFSFRMVIWSKKLQVATPVTAIGAVSRARTQRRRSY